MQSTLTYLEAGMTKSIGKANVLYRQNLAYAKRLWALSDSKALMQSLRELTRTFGFSVGRGELILLEPEFPFWPSGD